MKNKYSVKAIQQEVSGLDFDLKAETFAAFLEDKIPVRYLFSDYFKRRFSKDITGIEKDKEGEKIMVQLSRRSLYDVFPERFFHATYSSTPFVANMVNDYKNRKAEEESARTFFKPLEEEFFLHKVTAEKEENNIFTSLGSSELVNFLNNLWNIDSRFPKTMATKILKTMPFMYMIAGDLPLLTIILENIVQEDIVVTKECADLDTYEENDGSPLQLGVNLATEISGKTFLPKYTFTLSKVKRPEEIEKYLPDGNVIAVVGFFLEHTLPFECDFEVNFTVEDKKRGFVISDAVYAGRLGISSTI